MSRAVICKGDPTSHGGKVLEGAEHATISGRPIALRGHMTFCPQCKGTFPIVDGLDFLTFAGLGTALDGMQTACGAKLIATQQQMFIDDGGGAGGSGEGGSGAPAAVEKKESGAYQGRFRAVDEQTGQPVANRAYVISLPDGSTLKGVTDADGYTQQVSAHDPSEISLRWKSVEGAEQ